VTASSDPKPRPHGRHRSRRRHGPCRRFRCRRRLARPTTLASPDHSTPPTQRVPHHRDRDHRLEPGDVRRRPPGGAALGQRLPALATAVLATFGLAFAASKLRLHYLPPLSTNSLAYVPGSRTMSQWWEKAGARVGTRELNAVLRAGHVQQIQNHGGGTITATARPRTRHRPLHLPAPARLQPVDQLPARESLLDVPMDRVRLAHRPRPHPHRRHPPAPPTPRRVSLARTRVALAQRYGDRVARTTSEAALAQIRTRDDAGPDSGCLVAGGDRRCARSAPVFGISRVWESFQRKVGVPLSLGPRDAPTAADSAADATWSGRRRRWNRVAARYLPRDQDARWGPDR
jgi:hypothetical protein